MSKLSKILLRQVGKTVAHEHDKWDNTLASKCVSLKINISIIS